MQPDEEVDIRMTRMEAARVAAALSALCELQKMMPPGMASAMALDEAVQVIEGVLPRLREVFPADEQPTVTVMTLKVGRNDAKTYGPSADPFDMKVADLNLTPEESKVMYATEYDPAIQALMQSLTDFTDYTHDQFHELLDETKALLQQTMPVPIDLSVKDSQTYVRASDLVTLGALAYEMYKRQDQIDDQTTKPF